MEAKNINIILIKECRNVYSAETGDFSSLWKEAASMKQSRGHQGSEIEELEQREKVCFPVQRGRAAKILASDELAHFNQSTIKLLKCFINSFMNNLSLSRGTLQLDPPECILSVCSIQCNVQH